MDIKALLVLMLVLYVLPELFRRRKPKQYQYPDIPSKAPAVEKPDPAVSDGERANLPEQAEFYGPTQVQTTAAVKQDDALRQTADEKAESSVWLYGMIMAEVVGSPRGKNPWSAGKFNRLSGRHKYD